MVNRLQTILLSLVIFLTLFGCNKEPSPAMTPEEQLKTFEIASGLEIQLVAAEPLVQEPVAIRFDPKGRLWVVEMRGFMQDINGTDERAPIGRVSVLLDDNGDGQMDRSTVFADSLILPRSIAFVDDGVLIAEDEPLWFYKDIDGDLIADRRELVDSFYGKKGIVEHSPNGLLRGMDGWLYNAKSDHRYKRINGRWVKEETEFRGQWGISMDDVGRLYYNYNWSQLHADLVPPNYLNRNSNHTPTTGIDVGLTTNRKVFPIRPNLAANRGYLPETLDDEGKIKEFTSACSPFVYRGALLPDEFHGNVLVCEPVGNLIKRNIVNESTYQLSADDAYENREFLASTDERFRPVAITTGPDGALYISDMYRGIIEHGPYITEYLRDMILKRNLTQPVQMGRIWRIKPKDIEVAEVVDLTKMDAVELVEMLESSNGWFRDQAQQLLIERKDPAATAFLERKLRKSDTDFSTRIHCLWTLFELGSTNEGVYYTSLKDDNEHVRALAVRLLGRLADKGLISEERYSDQLLALAANDSDVVDLQIALSAEVLKADKTVVLKTILQKQYQKPLMRDAVLSSLENEEYGFMNQLLSDETWEGEDPGRAIVFEMLASAATRKADPREVLQLVASMEDHAKDLNWQWKAILDGMSLYAGEKDLPDIKIANKPSIFSTNSDFDESTKIKVASLASMFDWPGKESIKETSDESEFVVDPEQFANGRKQYLNVCAGCHGNDGKGLNRFGPPLRNSEWVLGSEKRFALLLIHGMKGPVTVSGKTYDAPDILPEMPSFSVIDDRRLADIMTYVRNEWGHQASPVSGRTVGGIRVRGQGKLTPWTAEELMKVEE